MALLKNKDDGAVATELELGFYESKSAIEPQRIPPEILSRILGKLEIDDLLNCRRTCRLWNAECKLHLRKLGKLSMYPADLEQYVEFLKEEVPKADLIMPIVLLLSDLNTTESELNSWEKHLDYLLAEFGEKCITELQLWDRAFELIGLEGFIRILDKISEGLSCLLIQNTWVTASEGDSFKLYKLEFPKLKKIRADYWRDWRRELQPEMTHLFKHIADKSPFLEKLRLSACTSTPDGIPFQKIRKLTLHDPRILEGLLTEIRKAKRAPIMQEFRYSSEGSMETIEHVQVMYNILNELAPTLKALDLGLTSMQQDHHEVFPKFPHLEKLRIEQFVWESEPWHFDPIQHMFTPEYFPALRNVVLPFGFFLAEDEHMRKTVSYPAVTELTLEVMYWLFKLEDVEDETRAPGWSQEFLERNISHLLSTFPNAVKLTLKRGFDAEDWKEYPHVHRVKELVKEILHSPHASRVQEFTVIGYVKDYVGQVLADVDNGAISSEVCHCKCSTKRIVQSTITTDHTIKTRLTSFMRSILSCFLGNRTSQNLEGSESYSKSTTVAEMSLIKMNDIKIIRMEPEPGEETFDPLALDFGDGVRSCTHNTLHLKLMAKYFPNMRRFQVSPTLLSSEDYASKWRTVREIQTQFPCWRVDVI